MTTEINGDTETTTEAERIKEIRWRKKRAKKDGERGRRTVFVRVGFVHIESGVHFHAQLFDVVRPKRSRVRVDRYFASFAIRRVCVAGTVGWLHRGEIKINKVSGTGQRFERVTTAVVMPAVSENHN